MIHEQQQQHDTKLSINNKPSIEQRVQRRQDATAPQIKPRGQQQSAALHNLNSGQQMVKTVSWLKNKQGQVTSGWGKGPIIVKVVNKSFTYKAKQAPPPNDDDSKQENCCKFKEK